MLYISNAKSFQELMKKNGYSRTQIKNHLWEYHYVFTHVLERTELRGKNVFVIVNVSRLDEKLGKMKVNGCSQRASKVILDDLTKWDVLIREYTNTKEKEKYSTRVRLKVHDSALVDGYGEWISDDILPGPDGEVVEYKVLTGIYKRLLDNLSILDFDAAGARAYAKNALDTRKTLRDKRVDYVLHKNRFVNRRVYASYVDKITKLEKRIWCASSDENKTKRFFTILHSTPAAIRDFVTIAGKKSVEVDISSSQCLMLAILLKRHYGEELPRDVAHYIELCETGRFYAYVQELVGAQSMQREAFKQEFFAKIFYSSERKRYQWRTMFADTEKGFPTVSAFITQQKLGPDKDAYKQFPVALSALESEIMLEGIATRLMSEAVTEFYTVHDAFYCTEDVRGRVKEVLLEVFAQYGVKAHVKEKPPFSVAEAVAPSGVVVPAITMPVAPDWLDEVETQSMNTPEPVAKLAALVEEEVEGEPASPARPSGMDAALEHIKALFAGIDDEHNEPPAEPIAQPAPAPVPRSDDEQIAWILAKLERHEASVSELELEY
ncbi:hypothetical protein [Hymenobacter actinosclerus]|uniref:Uncharacterized protein n=1 Tax=Hymenobacter actinosclerus TaxID=82805 RepID=A0A1I0IQN8_9BACT|nr:hypothetical protein [Hymenobacter actinosclerus]SET99530.1 hypothetical protein SAMN04487998_3454 [Hymenobacter actinosclerus]